jgi:phosphoglycolate phosphatase
MGRKLAESTKFAVFDCDGTLVDSQYVITQTMNLMFCDYDLPALDRTEVRRIVGLHLPEAIENLVPQAPEGVSYVEMAECYKRHFFAIRESGAFFEPVFDHVGDVLNQLHGDGITLGLATGKSRRGSEYVLEKHGFIRLFSSIKTADDGPGKPHPQILLDAMAEAGAVPENTIVIGDTTFDILLAKNAGAGAIGVNWGYHSPHELEAAGAARLVGSFADIPHVLEELWRQ